MTTFGTRLLLASVCLESVILSASRLRAQPQPTGSLFGNNQTAPLSSLNSSSFSQHVAEMKMGMRTPEQQCNIIGEYGAEPSMCMRGHDHFSRQSLLDHVPVFLAFWEQQKKLLPNHCCMGVNHMFAVHYLVSTLKPKMIVESGVAAGHQTFMLRQAAPTAHIFSIDPGDPSTNYPVNHLYGGFGHWKDASGLTTYLTGAFFKDFAELDWGTLIPNPEDRKNTLVILDDHQSCTERFEVLKKWGFRWAFYEDNYPFKVATSPDPYTCPKLTTAVRDQSFVAKYALGDAYSPNAVCGGPLPTTVSSYIYKTHFGMTCKMETPAEHAGHLTYVRQNMQTYYEFPALFTPCKTARPALLGNQTADLHKYGLPAVMMEIWQYGHLFPAFIELTPQGAAPLPDEIGGVPTTTATTTTTTTTTVLDPTSLGAGVNVARTERLVGAIAKRP